MVDRIVLVGAGQAAASLAETLRAKGHKGGITLVGDEPAPPYQRPPLSKKYLLGEMEAERLWLKPGSFYEEQGVELRLGVRAAAIDRASREVVLEDGTRLRYDRLALTIGARPRRLPPEMGGDLGGVHVVRTLADVDAMATAFRPGARLAVIGGGYIGLEAASVARSRGLDVTLIEAALRILGRVACAETADWFRALHQSHGVRFREGAVVEALEGVGGRLTGVRLAGGETVKADFAVVGIGVQPNVELAEAAHLGLVNGIAVDLACRTSDPLIFAAGDVASFPWRGRRIRLESVQNAIDQAKVAAASMLGEPIRYEPTPWFWSDQYDVKLQIAGLNLGYETVITRPGAREGTCSHWYFAQGRLVAVDAMNDARAYMSAKRWIEAGRSPEPAALTDPAADLKALA
ncbi:MAG: NAD(P)/FAD-dependent oxidoreductase [Rubrimonas sp.]|uniref:NAD(P)/FAD-dependent oxidoreductase n=1 Tax=Rubrimonas sp. TaxID=2036015 RepID=UPI002FDD3532